MKMRKNLFLITALTTYACISYAQGCPGGIPSAGNPGCIPPDQPNSPYYQGAVPQQQPQKPKGYWATRWGAIAIGSSSNGQGVVGIFKNANSKRIAQDAAMNQCVSSGGARCKISITYYNQCSAIAWGDARFVAQGAETIKVASELAMNTCNSKTTNCKIYYADCSEAEWVSY
jgi:hypothetical protein